VTRVKVLNHYHRNRKTGRQAPEHPAERGDAPGGCRDGHDVIRLSRVDPA